MQTSPAYLYLQSNCVIDESQNESDSGTGSAFVYMYEYSLSSLCAMFLYRFC